jgi:hypothetical protein
MKKIIVTAIIFITAFSAFAQEEEEEVKKKFFKKENCFAGGDITASFFNGGTVLGIGPYFGYSINRFVDVALTTNLNYTSQRDYQVLGDKVRQTVYGGGGFVRLFPVKFLFAQAQYEHNFIKLKYIPANGSGFTPETNKIDGNSFLVGGGYCNGRQGTGDVFYYFSVVWDISRLETSPYVDNLQRSIPIVRAGVQIPLFQGGGRRRRSDD